MPIVETADSASSAAFPLLEPVEARILGSLVEKAAITPEQYPLTINSLVAACNQKSSREPVMHLDPGTVTNIVRRMEERGLVKVAPASQRAIRYEHRFDAIYGTTGRQRAILAVLLLRGAQTIAELHTRTDRMGEFPAIDDVRDTLDRLIQREPALAIRIPRAHGQREDRYMHLLGGPVDIAEVAEAVQTRAASTRSGGLEERVQMLEGEIASLRDELAELRSRLDAANAS
jgi:uncharacterized protein